MNKSEALHNKFNKFKVLRSLVFVVVVVAGIKILSL